MQSGFSRTSKILFLTLTMTLTAASGVLADPPSGIPSTRSITRLSDMPQVISLTVHPAALNRPALKYRLLPDPIDSVAGNAAPIYLMATELFSNPPTKDGWTDAWNWLELPVDQLPMDQVNPYLSNSAMREASLAAHRDFCHWEIPVRQEGFMTLLPHLSKMRQLSDMLALQARIQIAHGQFPEAAQTLQTGTKLACDLNDQALLIQVMVGASIEGRMLKTAEQWIAAPGSPNLYWALTDLPQPFVDAKQAMASERAALYSQFPELREAATGHISAAAWASHVRRLAQMSAIAPGESNFSFSEIGIALAVAGQLPQAKQFLAEDGMPQEEINRLEPYQAIAAYWVRDYEQTIQGFIKWCGLPYAQARVGMERAEAQFSQERSQGMTTPFRTVLPAFSRPLFSIARVDRHIASLRCIEAIRAYAFSHSGQAPAKLEDMTETPIPLDPITGKAFGYRTTEHGFVLESVPEGLPQRDTLRFEVTIAQDKPRR